MRPKQRPALDAAMTFVLDIVDHGRGASEAER